jgi:TPR repeat protein
MLIQYAALVAVIKDYYIRLSNVLMLVVRRIRHIGLAMLLAGILHVSTVLEADSTFDPQNYPGQWALVTNQDATITATEKATIRHGEEVYQRVLLLKAVPNETPSQGQKATEAETRDFIRKYRPPPIPYTSETTAEKTGREKFNCLEFAEDIVAQAESNGIPAEVIGIKFEGKLIGHACAGFPTAEGRMLYFDSTPGSGQVSRSAHEARVELGKPYRRADGGELAGGVENLPITKIIPVNRLAEIASSLLDDDNPDSLTPKTKLVVIGENRQQAEGIEYAGPDTLQISEAQLARWSQAAEEIMAAKASQQDAQKRASQAVAKKLAANALQENEQLAAQGDAYGELRMGERYLTGDGVAKDFLKAQEYLQRAADQGSQTAADELKRLANQ